MRKLDSPLMRQMAAAVPVSLSHKAIKTNRPMWTYMEKATRLWLCVRMTTITTWNNISKKNCLPSWWRFPGQLLNLKQLKNWKISNLFVKELTKSWLNGYVRLKEQRIALGAQFRLSATACTFTHTHARGMFGNHQITPTLGKFLFSSEFFFFLNSSLTCNNNGD